MKKGYLARGQSALEYLVTYGWAILAIVIIGALLIASGVFNPGSFASSTVCKEGASLSCISADSVYRANGSATLRVGNKIGSQISNVYLVNATYFNGTVVAVNALCSASLDAGAKASCNAAGLQTGTAGNAYDEVSFLLNFSSSGGTARTDSVRLQGKYE